MRRIIEEKVGRTDIRKELKKNLEGVTEYLKYSYVTHLREGEMDPYHDIKFGLKHGFFLRMRVYQPARNIIESSSS